MGPIILLQVALVGFFICASVYALWTWWLSREERTLLIFAVQCVLCAGLSVAFVRLATAQTLEQAASALLERMSMGLLAVAATAFLVARITGVRARVFCWFVLAFAVGATLAGIVVGAPDPPRFVLAHVTLPWGETIAEPVWASPQLVQIAVYLVVTSVDVFAIIGGIRLASRDRLGAGLICVAAVTELILLLGSVAADLGALVMPNLGNLPFAFWVALIAVQLSRQNAQHRRAQAANDQRLRAIFDHTLHFMGLLDVDGTVLEANRPVLEAVGVPPEAVLGKTFWKTPLWAHSEELRERVRLACASAAKGETVRFGTWHPLPNGGVGHVDFSLKPIVDSRGAVVLLIPEGRDVTDRRNTQKALDRLVDVIAPRTGQDFFQTAVDALCEICEVDMALVASVDPKVRDTARTIAVSKRGQRAPNFTYVLEGTPCASLRNRELCYYPSGVQELFPQDKTLGDLGIESYMGFPVVAASGESVGHIAVLHAGPLRHSKQARALLQVIAGRAGAELERRRADAALVESERRFRTLIENVEVGVILQDAENRVLVSNPASARMLGLTRAELDGIGSRNPGWGLIREDGTVCPPDEAPPVVATRTRQTVSNATLGVIHRDTGVRTWLQVTASPQLRPDGTVQHVLVTIVDISDRKRAEEAARASSRRLALAISATSDAVWEWNYQTGEAYYSPRWFEMLGVAPSLPMTDASFRSLCHPDDLESSLRAIDDALRQPGSGGFEVEFRMRRGDGTWAWVLARGNAVERDLDGNPVLVAGTNTDITQRKEAEARRHELESRLAQSHRMESMGRLAGGIAHDFNNILTVINGYSDLLLHTARLDASAAEMLEDIRNAGERAAALTRQLLTFSRHQVVDPDTLELNLVVADTERMLQRLIGEHIHLETSLSETPIWVRADPGQLGQVIVNLAVNARDAMPNGGTLTVTTSLATLDEVSAASVGAGARPGQYAVLAVSDTGSGIPDDLQDLVFEPFFTTKGPGKGTGLGLTTVQGIVSQCDGLLSVKSQPGVGSTFTVYLPEAAAPDAPQAPTTEHELTMRERMTVLMVEDEEAVRTVVKTMLQRLGFEVLAAVDAEQALRVVGAHKGAIDLLLTDIIMPGLNGRQLAERLHLLRPNLPVVYMSGYTDDTIVQQVVLHADAAYLQKPFDSDMLARKIRQALESTPPASV